jgi:putative membrane protein
VRDDWLGWTTLGLLLLAALAPLMLLLREIIGYSRLARLHRLKTDVGRVPCATATSAASARPARRLADLYAGRRRSRSPCAAFREHARDVHDPGRSAGAGRSRHRRLARCEARCAHHRSAKRSPPSRPCRRWC